MRSCKVLPSVVALALLWSPSARACDLGVTACAPIVTVFPAYTPEGVRVGTVAAWAKPAPALERSGFTGQPQTVVFNNPASLPGAIDPEFTLMPLPHSPRFRTQAVYPRGY